MARHDTTRVLERTNEPTNERTNTKKKYENAVDDAPYFGYLLRKRTVHNHVMRGRWRTTRRTISRRVYSTKKQLLDWL